MPMISARAFRLLLPIAFGVAMVAAWEWAVAAFDVSHLVLPAPSLIGAALIENFDSLMASLWTTLHLTLLAFLSALVSGVLLAVLFSLSRTIEMTLYPYAVIIQVTPIFAIAPLIIIWVGYEHIDRALLILAWIAAFFPILANTTAGLRSVDPNLIDLFRLYGASRWQIFTRLQLPSALPHILSGMKISGGLALIGTIVAEFAAGSGTATGLGWRIVESGHRLEIPKQFAALILLAALGIGIFFALALLEWAVLRRWHESYVVRE
jgi:NitT/TauT family transport system permease protein